jgi:hypothetical protein
MADEEQQEAAAKLEPPRLFGRKKGRKASAPEPTPEPAGVEDTQVIEPEPAPEVDDTRVDAAPVPPAPPGEQAPPLFADEVQTVPASQPKPAREPRPAKAAKPVKEPKAPKAPKAPRQPLQGRLAAALTGLVIGLALVGATAGALRGCEEVQNTPTCGTAGFPLLVLIVVLMIVLGSVLLRAFKVPDPGSTSFLAVGLVSVVALLFFIEVIDAWWMIIAIPAVSVAAYLVSHWVTTTFIEPAEH